MNKRGSYIVFDCILGFTIIVVFLSTLKAPEMNPFNELAIAQKAHDLLTVWQAGKTFTPEELKKDFQMVFCGKSGGIFIGEEKINLGEPGGQKAFYFETFLLDENINPVRLGITVFD